MTTQTFISKAIEGGWEPKVIYEVIRYPGIMGVYSDPLLDPLAWQAVAKVEGWCYHDEPYVECECVGDWYKSKMHAMIDALAEGKTTEQYLETL